MSLTEEPTTTHGSSTQRCADCHARLAHDQRYCVECGARRGPLPAHVSQLVGAIRERGGAVSLPAGAPPEDSLADLERRPTRREFVMPGPRAAAFAVMSMLGFGVIVGSLVGGTPVESLASAPLIVVGLTHPAASPPIPQSAQTIIDTQTDAAGGAVAAAPASTPQPSAPAAAAPASSLPPATGGPVPATASGLPPVKHVFLIMLSDRGFPQSFGTSSGYLSGPLRRQGELVQNYYAVASAPLANEIALISGQGPTPQTASDCPSFTRIAPAHKGPRGQVLGAGCVYPPTTVTLGSQLAAAGDTWKAYVGAVGAGARTACRVPKLGSQPPQSAESGTEYLSWRNPFLYFRSLTHGTACRQNEVPISRLATDVKNAKTAPALAYIVPPPCADGSEAPCRPGAPTDLSAANRFLKTVVAEIKRSAAYKDGGLIAVTFDQAPQAGADADPSSCCGNPTTYPNLRTLPAPPAVPPAAMGTTTTSTGTGTTGTGITTTGTTTTGTGTTTTTGTGTTTATGTTTIAGTTTTGATTTAVTTTTPTPSLGAGATNPTGGGGQVGLLLISRYVKPNSSDVTDYFNHFSLLATIEELFGLHRLGYAGAPGLPVMGAPVFNNYAG